VECVFHIAALVGPFFPYAKYMGVNYNGAQFAVPGYYPDFSFCGQPLSTETKPGPTGTKNVIAACLECGVRKLVDCSSPSTRFKGGGYGGDVTGQTEEEMPYPSSFSHECVPAALGFGKPVSAPLTLLQLCPMDQICPHKSFGRTGSTTFQRRERQRRGAADVCSSATPSLWPNRHALSPSDAGHCQQVRNLRNSLFLD
jgi:hypothetical protein